VDIIVWSTGDYVQIAEYLDQQIKKDPENKPLRDSHVHFNQIKKVILAEKKAAQEVALAQQALADVKEKAAAGEVPAEEARIQALEARLAKLTATLAELEKMKRELGLERQKSEQLAQQLEEKQQREQLLLSRLSEGAQSPPVLLVASPSSGLKTEAGHVRLSGAVEDDRGLQQLDIYVNDRKLAFEDGRGIELVSGSHPRRLDFDRRIALSPGANTIRIHAVDTDGLYIEKNITVHHIHRRRNLWAVVVGIDAYPRLRRLKYAVRDAQAFYDWLVTVNRAPAENVTLLVDAQATLKRLRSALGTRLKNAAGADDLVIIFFAGHGAVERDMLSADGDGLEKYLLPYDTDPGDLYATALPMREIAHIFNRIRAERLIFLADACYSGASGGRTISVGGLRANLSDAFLARLAGGKGKIIITASGANEVSVEKDELRHGVFTYYLLEGLRGAADADGDGIITVDEAYGYVSVAVPRATGQEQHPVKKGTVEGRLLMGVVP
jgi:uncharacterized caspase-like protein